MSIEKIKNIVDSLHKKSKSGEKLVWKDAVETTSVQSYQVSFSKYSIAIEKRKKDGNRQAIERPSYKIMVLDWRGDVVEFATDSMLDNYQKSLPQNNKDMGLIAYAFIKEQNTYNEKMKDIYESARGIAKGIDEALDDILNELNKK